MMNVELAPLQKAIAHLRRQIFIESLKRKPLVFSFENIKVKGAYTFSIPAGWTCPGALNCLARVCRESGKLRDGKDTVFRCFSATQEAVYPNVRMIRWHNYDLLQEAQDAESMAYLILESLPESAELVRIHVSGDFYNQNYFDAWVRVARLRPDTTFYAYTKSVNFWANRLFTDLPSNLKLTASFGGRHDTQAEDLGLKSARVVFSEEEAAFLNLEIDHDDTHAWKQDESFALLVHGTQPPGSEASKSWTKQLAVMRKEKESLPKKVKRPRPQPTIGQLVGTLIKLVFRLTEILETPVYVVKRVATAAGAVRPRAGISA